MVFNRLELAIWHGYTTQDQYSHNADYEIYHGPASGRLIICLSPLSRHKSKEYFFASDQNWHAGFYHRHSKLHFITRCDKTKRKHRCQGVIMLTKLVNTVLSNHKLVNFQTIYLLNIYCNRHWGRVLGSEGFRFVGEANCPSPALQYKLKKIPGASIVLWP